MKRENIKARMLRALAGKTQDQAGEEVGVHPTLISQFENGKLTPSPEHLGKLAKMAGLTAEEAERLLTVYETLLRPRRRQGRSVESLFDGMAAELRPEFLDTCRRLLTLALPPAAPRAEDRAEGDALFARLTAAPHDLWAGIVEDAEEFHHWALCERACRAAAESGDRERAIALARLGVAVAERVNGPAGWSERLRGYAQAAEAAVTAGEEAARLWRAGCDPDGLLAYCA